MSLTLDLRWKWGKSQAGNRVLAHLIRFKSAIVSTIDIFRQEVSHTAQMYQWVVVLKDYPNTLIYHLHYFLHKKPTEATSSRLNILSSSVPTDKPRTFNFPRTSRCRQLSDKLRFFYFSFKAYFEFPLAEFQSNFKTYLITFKIHLLNSDRPIQSAHIRVDFQPLLTAAPL